MKTIVGLVMAAVVAVALVTGAEALTCYTTCSKLGCFTICN